MCKRVVLLTIMGTMLTAGLFAQGTLPTPQNLKASVTDGPAVMLTWDAPMGLWGYKVYRSTTDESNYQSVGIAASKTYKDESVVGGDKYFYYVTSFGLVGGSLQEGGKSNVASVVVPGNPTKGTIVGKVTDESDGVGITYVQVQIYKSAVTTEWIQVITDQNGMYQVTVDPGTYVIYAIPPYSTFRNLKPEWYKDAADRANATPVIVSAGGKITANIALGGGTIEPPGTIKGKIIDDVTKLPIASVHVLFFNKAGMTPLVSSAVTDIDGNFKADLPAGGYILKAEPKPISGSGTAYEPEWYDNVKSADSATVVTVKSGETAIANFGLAPRVQPLLVKVSGIVKDAQGAPLPNARVVLMRTMQEIAILAGMPEMSIEEFGLTVNIESYGECRGVAWTGFTDDKGLYTASVPGARTYIALATKPGYLPEYYLHKASPMMADPIKLGSRDTTGIGFTLVLITQQEYSVSGTVKDSSGRGIPSRVLAVPVSAVTGISMLRCTHTDANGVFTLQNVRAGKYAVLAVPFWGYAPAFYKKGEFGVLCLKEADIVDVQATLTHVDIGVRPIRAHGLAHLLGRLRAKDGAPLTGGRITALSTAGVVLGYGVTDTEGAYSLENIDPGAVILTADREGYQPVITSVPVPGGTLEVNVVDIVLNPEAVTAGPSAELQPEAYRLYQNYPNPFNPTTTISVDLPAASTVRLTVHNLLGQELITLLYGSQPAGRHEVVWNGHDGEGRPLASGIYMFRFTAREVAGDRTFSETRKMLLLK